MAHKLIEAAKEAVKVASCEHDLKLLGGPTTSTPNVSVWIYRCRKCEAVIRKPQKMWGNPLS